MLENLKMKINRLGGTSDFQSDEYLVGEIDSKLEQLLINNVLISTDVKTILGGKNNNCHGNSIDYWANSGYKAELFNGFAKSENGRWIYHSWIQENGKVIETTSAKFDVYVGMQVNTKEKVMTIYGSMLK